MDEEIETHNTFLIKIQKWVYKNYKFVLLLILLVLVCYFLTHSQITVYESDFSICVVYAQDYQLVLNCDFLTYSLYIENANISIYDYANHLITKVDYGLIPGLLWGILTIFPAQANHQITPLDYAKIAVWLGGILAILSAFILIYLSIKDKEEKSKGDLKLGIFALVFGVIIVTFISINSTTIHCDCNDYYSFGQCEDGWSECDSFCCFLR